MQEPEIYDAIIVGCGESGKYMGWHLGKAGKKVAVIEQRYIGGSCPNIACLPSKNIIASANVAHLVAHAGEYGTAVHDATTSMAAVQARKQAMVAGLIDTHLANFRASGAELVMGRGVFAGERTVEVTLADGGTRTFTAEHVFLDLGAFASVPDLPGMAAAAPLTHVELLDLETLPEHLLVLGGGYVALELAQAMRRLGARVTLIEMSDRLLPREDPDIGELVTALLAEDGIELIVGARNASVSGRSGAGVAVTISVGGVPRTVEGSHLLVATGKRPNTTDIGLEAAGIELTRDGYVRVNDRLETTAAGVWAMGDCAGSPPFTHIAFEDFRIVRDNLFGAGGRSTVGRQVPSCLFIEPELARIGLTEQEARQKGIPFRLASIPAKAILRTRTNGQNYGKLKLLVGEDDLILGFTAFCDRAGELLPTVQLAMAAGLSYRAIERLVIAHPTYAEGLTMLFSAVPAAS